MARRAADDFENTEFFLELQAALGREIRRLREERSLSQRELAAVAYVSGPHFGMLESGVGNVTLLVLAKLARGSAFRWRMTPGRRRRRQRRR